MEKELTQIEKTFVALQGVQGELKAPKDKYNSFGKYAYRSAEGILEAVKPLLTKYAATLTLSDEVILIGERFYIKAVASFAAIGGEEVVSVAYAREDEVKKGMDGSQITGAASSYARKYALNGLFLIDDAKDADTDEYVSATRAGRSEKAATDKLKAQLIGCKSKEEISKLWNRILEIKDEFTGEEWKELRRVASEWAGKHKGGEE